MLQTCDLITVFDIALTSQSPWTDAGGHSIGNTAGPTTYWKFATWSSNAPICALWQHKLQFWRRISARHKFPCFDWTPARDCLPDQVTCALWLCISQFGGGLETYHLWSLPSIWSRLTVDTEWWTWDGGTLAPGSIWSFICWCWNKAQTHAAVSILFSDLLSSVQFDSPSPTTTWSMCGVKSLNGSHGTYPMYGWFVQIVSWSGMFHLQPHQPKTLMLEIKPWNRSWRVWYDSFTSVRCDCDLIISRLVYFRWTYIVWLLCLVVYPLWTYVGWTISHDVMSFLRRKLQHFTVFSSCCMGRVWVFQCMYQFNHFNETFAAKMLQAFGVSWLFDGVWFWDDEPHLSPLKCWLDVFILLLCNLLHDDGNSIYLWSGSNLPVLLRRDRSKCECSGLREPLQLEKGAWGKKKHFTKKAFFRLSWPHLGPHLDISRLEFHQGSFLEPILPTSWASSWNLLA